MKMTKKIGPVMFMFFFLFYPSGCIKMALRMTPDLMTGFSLAIFEECDPQLAKDSIPSNLKLLEGLLKSDPENHRILTTLCMGYTGYALLFLEENEPERASRVYLRAKDYGLRALGDTGAALKDRTLKPAERRTLLLSVNQDRKAALIWTTVAWSAWINLNLDRPSALAQLGNARAFLDRVMALDAAYFNGLPHIMMGVSYAARPPMMGGDMKSAGRHFRKALEQTDRQFFLAQYYFARYYAVRAQDKSLFLSLLEEVKKGDEKALKEACLINTMVKVRMKKLEEMTEELFL